MVLTTKDCDYLVIGGGSGGLASARRASKLYGAKTIIVEAKRLGGTCVNVGCVPKKVTWHAASIRETLKDAKNYGFSLEETKSFDWQSFVAKRSALVKRLNTIHEEHLKEDEVEYLHGVASFKDSQTVEVTLEGSLTRVLVKAKHILIAVGGRPSIPGDVEGSELGITSDGFFELERQPRKVAIVGAGYIAVELAGMFNALGTETHMFIRHDRFLRTFDPMIQEQLMAEYQRHGIVVHKQSSQAKVEDIGSGWKRLHYKDQDGEAADDFDCILWAIGRTTELGRLSLDVTNVKLDGKSRIKTDKYQNTNIEHIKAIGDGCDRGFELTPVAIAAGRRLADRLFGGDAQIDAHLEYDSIPSVVFSHPEIGSIGLTEPAARKQYGDSNIKVYNTKFNSLYYSVFDDREDAVPCSYKLICAGQDQKVVGLHIIGPGSSEMLQGFGVAIKMGATKADFDRCVAIHPTNAEELVTLK
ncbi:hypothetical protein M409DRAFT_68441 [Zasmidium cellare ATCC 36951]|uniref:Glutathione reductase n=1 Tax=Zasmidium cellare ATCC 36951 TaxID=1080233 RepID=A0A6A6CDK4_ZASCE|nr:uncharacterized protein M409DRAFT_68441 [Zasmidium cellare ATCC 36951]KAF2163516.1 hypothetical protein M409DRAFT_68441 [Zasmidium cellare ATCC 36951]